MREIFLTEYQVTEGVVLSLDERDTLQEIVPSLVITPSRSSPSRYDLQPTSWVGAVSLSGLSVEIRPKISISRLMFLLIYAGDPVAWRRTPFAFESATDIFESIVPPFLIQVRRSLQRGLLQGYLTREEALNTVRGRLLFTDLVHRRYGRFPPIACRFDEFTEDILENRLIKAALVAAGKLVTRSPDTQREIGRLFAAMANVQLERFVPHDLPEVRYNRLNDHYRASIELAKLILQHASFEVTRGSVTASAFLLDMNVLFEDFAVRALREELGLSVRQFPQQSRGRAVYLAEGNKIKLEPDLSWWESSSCVFVGDAKYKKSPKNADIYQLLAYMTAAGLDVGMLLYAAGESEPQVLTIPRADKTVHIRALDLSLPPDAILQQTSALANFVVELRKAAVPEGAMPLAA